MTLTADNVRVAVTGVVSVGPTTATAPADADTALTALTNEVQTVTEGGSGLTSFTLTYSGQTTASITAAATAAAVRSALEALSNIAPGDVTVTGATSGPYTVTFRGTLASTDVAEMTATPTGGTGTVTIATATPGVADGYADLGYVSEDGVTETRDRSSDTIKAWQNGDVVREVITEANYTLAFTMLETKRETVELYYGTTIDPADGSLIVVPSKTGGRKSYVVDVVDGDDFIRTYIPSGEITEVGDQVYANGEPIGYEVTLRGYPSSALPDENGDPGSAKKWYSSLVVA